MAVLLSPVGGVAGQFFDNNGNPLSGGKMYSYVAGTTTPQVTYTSGSGATAHSNPIVLDSGGRVPGGEIWLTDGFQYKFVLKTSTDVLIGTYDNIVGINSNFVNFLTETEVQTATASQTVFTLATTTYQPGTNTLSVFVDGVNQYDGITYAYVETSSTVVTFTAGLHVGALVKFTTAQTLSSGVTDASIVTYQPAGTGAVATTVQTKLRESVNLMNYATLQQAVNAAITAGVALKVTGHISTSTTATFAGNLTIIGDSREVSSLIYTGTGLFLNQTSGDLLSFEKISLSGVGNNTVGPIAVVGSECFRASNNVTTLDSRFNNWTTVSTWVSGFYHKHIDTFFEYCTTFFSGWNQNNLSFFGCRFSNFQTGISIASGEGPITLSGCSIEYVADKFIVSTVSRSVCANIIGCYIEQGVSVACPIGITSSTGFFNNGTIIYSNGTEVYANTFIGCTVFTPGIFRMFWSDNANGCNVTGSGNTFIARGLAPTDCLYTLGASGSIRANLNDTVVGALPAGFASYVTNYPTDLNGCSIFNPIALQQLRPTTHGWTNLTLLNGFTNTGSPFANAQFFQDDNGKVHFRGSINGSSATGTVLATLPTDNRPTTAETFVIGTNNGAFTTATVTITSNGNITFVVAGPYINQIGLSPISFYVGT